MGHSPRAAWTAFQYGESRVNVGEVCQGCCRNQLTISFVLGNGDPPEWAGYQ